MPPTTESIEPYSEVAHVCTRYEEWDFPNNSYKYVINRNASNLHTDKVNKVTHQFAIETFNCETWKDEDTFNYRSLTKLL